MRPLRHLIAATRLLRAIGHCLRGMWVIRWHLPHMTPPQREARIERWARDMLALFNVTLQVEGERQATGPLLLVANHVSWLDILVMQATRQCRFVSKAELRHWPLIGNVATGVGTLYIERASRRDALRVVHHMADSLRAGDVLAVFPEGTTSDGEVLLPFHANLLQAAISADAPAQPLGIRFVDTATGQRSRAAVYAGADTLLGSLWRTLTANPITAVVRLGRPQRAEGQDRRNWAETLHAEVDALR
ncbi:lysophospholipid acyltransferase family protein [Xylophilus sp. GW821-FHT01B05]